VTFKRWFESTLLPLPEVNRRLALELNGLTQPYPSPTGAHPLTGHRLPDLELQLPDGIVPVGELLRSGHFLALDLTGDDRFRDLSYQSAPVDVASGVPVRLPDALRSASALLIRPDAYIGWAGNGNISAETLDHQIRQWLCNAA
jgi:hypothetical protein